MAWAPDDTLSYFSYKPNIAFHLPQSQASHGFLLLNLVRHCRRCWCNLTHLVLCSRRTPSAHSTVSSDPFLRLLPFILCPRPTLARSICPSHAIGRYGHRVLSYGVVGEHAHLSIVLPSSQFFPRTSACKAFEVLPILQGVKVGCISQIVCSTSEVR